MNANVLYGVCNGEVGYGSTASSYANDLAVYGGVYGSSGSTSGSAGSVSSSNGGGSSVQQASTPESTSPSGVQLGAGGPTVHYLTHQQHDRRRRKLRVVERHVDAERTHPPFIEL